MRETNPQVSELAFRKLLSFTTTYYRYASARAVFQLLYISKTKARSRRKVEDDLGLVLSSTKPRIPKLALLLQSQPSH